MESIEMLRIDSLKLKNFRCFSDISIDFHPRLTVLVAENTQGKTAILDAVGISLGLYVDIVTNWKQYPGFARTDVRVLRSSDNSMTPQVPVSFFATGYAGGDLISWSRTLPNTSSKSRTSTKDARELEKFAVKVKNNISQDKFDNSNYKTILPVIAFYGTGRLWSEHRLTEFRKASSHIGAESGRVSGYLDCLSSTSSFKEFVEWYGHAVRDIGDARFKVLDHETHPLKWVTAVRNSVKTVLEPTGWHTLDWDNELEKVVAEHETNGRLLLEQMSDGVRNMISLIADLAHKCARLNPGLGEEAALKTPGILLIDEVDMHLHPRWQQLIIQLLETTFPEMQIIVSTHSPHVLSTVDKSSIRIIHSLKGVGTIKTPEYQTKGIESADVLASIMGVDPIPKVKESIDLSHYRALIEDGLFESEDARTLRIALNEHFGVTHPVIIDCDRLIRFQKLKNRHSNASTLNEN